MKKIVVFIFMLTAFFAFGQALAEDGAGLDIVVTDFPCYDFARAVAGDSDGITMLIKPGAEAHTFDPTPADVAAMMEADVFIYIGGESDVWAEEMLSTIEGGPLVLRMFDCVEAVETEHLEKIEHDHEEAEAHEGYDEHIWTSPENAERMVQAVADALSRCDAAGAETYAANAQAYIDEIDAVDQRIQSIVDNAARNELVFGDRFPFLYLAKQYGLDYYAAFPGCAAETEPSARTLMFLIDHVISEKIPAVYKIEMSTGVIADTIAKETGAEVLTLHSMQNVTAEEFSAGETYVSLMNKNAEALEKGLN
jgi:zinc transport system substrate-binding protein